MKWDLIGPALQAAVRPVVTFLFAAAIVVGFLQGRLSGETFMGTAGVIMAFWFGQRETTKEAAAVATQAAQRAVGLVTSEGGRG